MYQIERSHNRLRQLAKPTFASAGLRERDHLQEWLATSPEALGQAIGEELLIIQKEFDGFDGTRERLDLLALDKSGQLVVIENKLDDSGRDVVWQALKYAAYCSSLKKAEVITIFQQFLDRGAGGDATGKVCDFLGEDSLEEVVLNEGNDQRIIFIAANFRREVTSTVLWLREHQIDARCVKVTAYQFHDELFIDLQQVIPTPEAADYMIRMAEKDTEEKTAKGAQKWSHQMRMAFWTLVLESFREAKLERWQNISPSRDHWLTSTFGVTGCKLVLIFLRHEIRVELQFDRADKSENKWLFDQLQAQAIDMPAGLLEELEWRRIDESKVSMISCKKPVQGYSEENWPEMIAWLKDRYIRMNSTFTPAVAELASQMRTQ